MNRIAGKLVLITGASSGIGAACARRFAADGARLILWARRLGRLLGMAEQFRRDHEGMEVTVAPVDVRDREGVMKAAADLVTAGTVPDVLINNAGLGSGLAPVQEGAFEDWDLMIDTNLKGLLNVTRALLPHMISQGRGHVVNLGSLAGHQVYAKGNVYAATKFGVRALTEAINLDLTGTPLRASSVDPGLVETEFSVVRFHGDADRARAVYRGMKPLSADDVADAIAYVVTAPEHVNVLDLVIVPTAQRSVHVVDRKT